VTRGGKPLKLVRACRVAGGKDFVGAESVADGWQYIIEKSLGVQSDPPCGEIAWLWATTLSRHGMDNFKTVQPNTPDVFADSSAYVVEIEV